MIRVVDLEGNSYPIPSHNVLRGCDLYLQLFQRYSLSHIDLFCKHSFVSRECALDEDALHGIVPIAAIPSHCQQPPLNSLHSPPGGCSVDRFSHFAFGGVNSEAIVPNSDWDDDDSDVLPIAYDELAFPNLYDSAFTDWDLWPEDMVLLPLAGQGGIPPFISITPSGIIHGIDGDLRWG
jgi:hypothetical protein